jgi:hypothetical protein
MIINFRKIEHKKRKFNDYLFPFIFKLHLEILQFFDYISNMIDSLDC